ncbi:MAG: ABC transporter substrate-binding protein [Lachnospiraceae bacterium]
MKKKVLTAMMTVMMMAVCTTGCADEDGQKSAEEKQTAEGTQYTIGINQFAEHGSLDNCRKGFLQGLAQEGIVEGENLTVLFENAQSDTGIAGQISDNFVSQNVDLICAIATPSACSSFASCMNTEIPVVYTAVSDPVGAELANEDGTGVGNVTGTSDRLPVEEQLAMIRRILPDADTIGIIYTTSEANSLSTIAEYEAAVAEYGFTLETVGITAPGELPTAVDSMIAKDVDCINNLTDNTVVQGLAMVLSKADAAKIPVFGSEVEQVKNGCLASVGIEYVDLGVQTGQMAAKVLKGEAEASELKYELISRSGLYVNTAVAENLGITLDEAYIAEAVEIFDSIAE